MKKIVVIGCPGAGKSTFARRLKEMTGLPLYYLDQIWHKADRTTVSKEEFDAKLREIIQQDSWIIDGNYTGFSQERRLREADLIIFMNYPRWICLWQALVRSRIYRGRTREDMGDGCIEKMDWEFVWWILHKGRSRKKKRQYRSIAERYQEKTLVVKNRRQLRSVMIQVVERRKDRLSTGGRTI